MREKKEKKVNIKSQRKKDHITKMILITVFPFFGISSFYNPILQDKIDYFHYILIKIRKYKIISIYKILKNVFE